MGQASISPASPSTGPGAAAARGSHGRNRRNRRSDKEKRITHRQQDLRRAFHDEHEPHQ